MSDTLRWGLMGTGPIARTFAKGLRSSRTGLLTAIGSRSSDAAARFSDEFPAHCHASYEALLADGNVDAVYIATPHPFHAEWAVRAAEAGKHILCEKPLTMTRAEAEQVVDAARRHDVFLMEAFMYRCHPQTAKLVELIREKTIGEVQYLRAAFSFATPYKPESRLFNRALGGGGILDVGCYAMSMARLIAGAAAGKPFLEPLEIVGVGRIGETSGVDEFAIASLKFPNGILAEIACGLRVALDNNVRIIGTEGSILVPSPWFITGANPGFSKIVIFRDGIPEEVVIEADRGIYSIEADHVSEHLAARQSPAMPWADSLGNMSALESWLAAARGS